MKPERVWPKTAGGWWKLLWLTIHCCPVHKLPLSRDWALYDRGTTGYCFACTGIGMYPLGLRQALEWNARGIKRGEEEQRAEAQG